MRALLFSLVTIFSFLSAKATIKDRTTNKTINNSSSYHQTVSFFEKGIEFHIFLNGEFDFNTNVTGRCGNGVRIERDFNGNIRRVGNVFVNYDYNGNVKRIGNVFLRYHYGKLESVGDLEIYYDHWGNPHFEGQVKRMRKRNFPVYYNSSYHSYSSRIYDYDDRFFYRKDFRSRYQQYKEDKEYYYYRPFAKTKGNTVKYIKRKKRRTQHSYRKPSRKYTKEQKTVKSRRS